MVGVVIVTYQSSKYIQACLESVFRELERLGEKYCVYIVDNASQDSATDLVRGRFEPLHVIENEQNVGFAKASNQGIKKCLGMGCREVLLLNPDTWMEEGSFEKLLSGLRSDEGLGVVQPLITLMSDPSRINTCGNEKKWWGGVGLGGYGERVRSPDSGVRSIEYASGACMLVKREVFETVGLLDEKYFLYFEDSEFSERVKSCGWALGLVREAVVHHDYQMQRSIRQWGIFVKSWYQFVKRGGHLD